MTPPAQLKQSSVKTRSWLKALRDDLPTFNYRESAYWGSFRTRPSGTAVAYLNPSKSKLRVFLQLQPSAHDQLQSAPSTKSWRKRFPSVYEVSSAGHLPLAAEFIRWSFVNAAPSEELTAASDDSTATPARSQAILRDVVAESQLALVKQRRGQDRVRRLTLLNYGSACAVCDVRDPSLLVASHIVRWADSFADRGVLSNIICLCSFHDVLFDRGYWSLTDDLRVLRDSRSPSHTVATLLPGKDSFRRPLSCPPSPTYLAQHRARFDFQRA